jgi:hypothetical protein
MTNLSNRPERPKLGLLFGGAAARSPERRSPVLSSDELRRIISETIG